MSDIINTEYISDCMKERYKVLFSRKLRFKDKLKTVTVEHGYLLPVKKIDSKYLMGRGGVLDRDGKFVPAEGEISGSTLRLKAEGIPHPVKARYAWTDWSDKVNLFGGNGLPLEPFSL